MFHRQFLRRMISISVSTYMQNAHPVRPPIDTLIDILCFLQSPAVD